MKKKIVQIITADGWSLYYRFGSDRTNGQEIFDLICWTLDEDGDVSFCANFFGEICSIEKYFKPEKHHVYQLIRHSFNSPQEKHDFIIQKNKDEDEAVDIMISKLEKKRH